MWFVLGFLILFVCFKTSILSKQPFFQHGENLQVVSRQQEPSSRTALGYPWVPRLGELLRGAAWDGELGLHRSAGLEDGLY